MADKYNSKVVLANGTVLMDLTADTVDAAHLLATYTAHGKDGAPITGACTYDSDTSEDTAAVGEILISKSAHARGTKLVGTMPNNGAVSGTISTKAGTYTIPQGYHDGSGRVSIATAEQEKLVPGNIKAGCTLLGILGEYSGESITAQAKTATPTFAQQIIQPDTGFDYLSQVTVAQITVTYSDNSAGGQTVTIGATA